MTSSTPRSLDNAIDLLGRAWLLASTLIEQAHLWTADESLLRLAREAGVAHDLRAKS